MGVGQTDVVHRVVDSHREHAPKHRIVFASIDSYYFLKQHLHGSMAGLPHVPLHALYSVVDGIPAALRTMGIMTEHTEEVYFADEVPPAVKQATISDRSKAFGTVEMPAELVGDTSRAEDMHANFRKVVESRGCPNAKITAAQASEFLSVTRSSFRKLATDPLPADGGAPRARFTSTPLRLEGELGAFRAAINFASGYVKRSTDPFSVVIASADTDMAVIAMANYDAIMKLPDDTVYWYDLYHKHRPRGHDDGGNVQELRSFVNLSSLCRRNTSADARAFAMMCMTTGTDYTVPVVGCVRGDQVAMYSAFLSGADAADALLTERLKNRTTTWIREGRAFRRRLEWIYQYYQSQDGSCVPNPHDYGWDPNDPRDAEFMKEKALIKEKKALAKKEAVKSATPLIAEPVACTETPAASGDLAADSSPKPSAVRTPVRRGRVAGTSTGPVAKKPKTSAPTEPSIVVTEPVTETVHDEPIVATTAVDGAEPESPANDLPPAV